MSDLPPSVAEAVQAAVGTVLSVKPVGGGCISSASRVETPSGPVFLKWAAGEAGGSFEAEAAGLNVLQGAGSQLRIPDVLAVQNRQPGHAGFLLMEWLEPGSGGPRSGKRLGEGLATLHGATEPEGRYGFGSDNFIGRLPQRNGWSHDWPAFFAEYRLAPQISMARQRGGWRAEWDPLADPLLARLAELLPHDPPPATLHGDLWSGNVLHTASGEPALVDPAAYFGHAETDLAMMTLFGGFAREVFDAYHAALPRQPGHDDREAVYQLYHLINHLNHFGAGYASGVERVLRRFG